MTSGADHFRYLEHDADQGIEVEAGDLGSLWNLGAQALIGVMTDVTAVGADEERQIEVDAPDRTAAWVESLGELVFRFETEGLLLCRVDRVELREHDDGVRVRFRARGERYDPARHPAGTGVKAVTHHQASLEQCSDGRWRARVLLDL